MKNSKCFRLKTTCRINFSLHSHVINHNSSFYTIDNYWEQKNLISNFAILQPKTRERLQGHQVVPDKKQNRKNPIKATSMYTYVISRNKK